jgi:hypothetical protein
MARCRKVAGLLYLVAEKSRSLNMQSFNRRELIIQLSEAYRCFCGQRGCPTSSRTSARYLMVAGFLTGATGTRERRSGFRRMEETGYATQNQRSATETQSEKDTCASRQASIARA